MTEARGIPVEMHPIAPAIGQLMMMVFTEVEGLPACETRLYSDVLAYVLGQLPDSYFGGRWGMAAMMREFAVALEKKLERVT